METAGFVAALTAEGELLADTADRSGWDAVVATCPGWRMRDLVAHLGTVHRWATGYVRGDAIDPAPPRSEAPGDAALGDWFRDGHRALVDALSTAPPDLECWTFLPAPSPLAFWARRQAHETAMHRIDAESAAVPRRHAPLDADFALDGLDELLVGFHGGRRSRVRAERPGVLRIRATAGPGSREGRSWLLRLSPDAPPRVGPGTAADAGADCTVEGPADVLYPALWNRTDLAGLRVTGDARLAEAWRTTSAI